MTSDEIRALEAGPKLDRLVAEKVMGWSPTPGWHPSLSRLDAWDVVEKLQELGYCVYLSAMDNGEDEDKRYGCKIAGRDGWRDMKSYDICGAIPRAICRAALLAVEDGIYA